MATLFTHLTTRKEEHSRSRNFEAARSCRLHWIKHHVDEQPTEKTEVFSFEDRIDGKSIIRTYIYDISQKYVVILEPQRSGQDYFLLTAYYLNEPGGEKQIKNKLKKKLPDVH